MPSRGSRSETGKRNFQRRPAGRRFSLGYNSTVNYRLIALDLDGTLLQPDQNIHPRALAAIAKAQAQGVLIVPCTGRSWRESVGALSPLANLHAGVFCTGAVLADMASGKTLERRNLPPAVSRHILTALHQETDAVLAFTDADATGHEYFVTGKGKLTDNTRAWFRQTNIRHVERETLADHELGPILRISMVTDEKNAFRWGAFFEAEHAEHVEVHAFEAMRRSAPEEPVYLFELFAKEVSKWDGLVRLAKRHGIAQEEIAVIGDEINDLPMLRHAACSVVMANGVPAAKEAARYETLANTEGGVGYAIEKMLEGAW